MTEIRPGDKPSELKVFDHGFVRLDASMADDLSVVNSARVSFAVRKEEMDDKDKGLIKFLMRDHHGTPFEHNSFRFHIRCPIFVAREWFRHRVGCLTGDTVVTFVDINGRASKARSKTIDQLWKMWTEGELNGNGLTDEQEDEIKALSVKGESIRSISRLAGTGRRGVRRTLVHGTTRFRRGDWRVKKMKLRVLNEHKNEFETGHIADIFQSGVQPVYRVTLADGKSLNLTENHRVLTESGWQTLREALGLEGVGIETEMTKSAKLITNGKAVCQDHSEPTYKDYGWVAKHRKNGLSVQQIADQAGCSYHTVRKWLRIHGLQFGLDERGFKKGLIPWNKDRPGYTINKKWTEEYRAAVREARSGPKSNWWRGGIAPERANIARWTTEQAPKVHFQYNYRCQAKDCPSLSRKLHAHHIMPVWLDASRARSIGNLMTVCSDCHLRIHRTQNSELKFAEQHRRRLGFAEDIGEVTSRRGCKLSGHPVSVVSCEYIGLKPTYDLTIDGPWHNFVANGIVVHNSFNEESARYHRLSDDFYVPEPEAVRSQVGKPGSYHFDPVEPDLAAETIGVLRDSYAEAYDAYVKLVDKGVAKELARAILPFGIYTQFYWTINARSLMNFIALRNAQTAQYEIRIYAQAIERFFEEKMPVTYECFQELGRMAP